MMALLFMKAVVLLLCSGLLLKTSLMLGRVLLFLISVEMTYLLVSYYILMTQTPLTLFYNLVIMSVLFGVWGVTLLFYLISSVGSDSTLL